MGLRGLHIKKEVQPPFFLDDRYCVIGKVLGNNHFTCNYNIFINEILVNDVKLCNICPDRMVGGHDKQIIIIWPVYGQINILTLEKGYECIRTQICSKIKAWKISPMIRGH